MFLLSKPTCSISLAVLELAEVGWATAWICFATTKRWTRRIDG